MWSIRTVPRMWSIGTVPRTIWGHGRARGGEEHVDKKEIAASTKSVT